MEMTSSFSGLACRECGRMVEATEVAHHCPDCGGLLDPEYNYPALDLTRDEFDTSRVEGVWRYEKLLPFSREVAVTLNEGGTALVPCPTLAEELGVGKVFIKDEGRNPTGSFKDRGAALAMTAAREHGATDVALATAGNAGQAAAAYAARADLAAHVFVPSRANFVNKATINTHGADMRIVEGRIDDASRAFHDALADHEGWYSVGSFHTPYRHEGKKTMYFEIVEQLDWTVPDAVVYPTGGGVGLVGMHKAAGEFHRLGLVDDVPAFYVAQSTGCAPIVEAVEAGRDGHQPWDAPDTICGGIEIPDPRAGPWVLDAVRESGGGAVATDDEQILDTAVTVARHAGLEIGVTAAAAAAGAWSLAQDGTFSADDTVVLMNTAAGIKDADVVRSHLMSKGL